MNTAVVQPSVVTRFNPHPPEPLAFFNNNTNFVETFLEVCDPYNDKVLEKNDARFNERYFEVFIFIHSITDYPFMGTKL